MAWWVLQNVAIAAALAAVVALVCRLTRIGPVARHALWLLVLIKLLTPPLIVWPWPVPDVLGLAEAHAADVPALTDAGLASPARLAIPVTAMPAEDVTDADRHGARPSRGATVWPWAIGVWALGSALLLAIELTRIARLARRIRDGAPVDGAIQRRADALAGMMGVAPVPIVIVAALNAPAVWSLGRPVLMWPPTLANGAGDACVDGLLVHELAHLRRRDHLVGWLELAAGIAWWWNPLFWYVRSALREQAELACDVWVVSMLPDGRRAYAESLLALSGAAVAPVPSGSLVVVGIHATSRRVLERRLVMIMKGRSALRLPLGGLVAIALVAGATLPAWAIGAAQQTTPPVAVPTTPTATTPPAVAPTAPQATTPQKAVAPATVPTIKTAQAPPAKASTPKQTSPKIVTPGTKSVVWIRAQPDTLPADGQELLQGFEKDRAAIQQEAEKKIDERRLAVIKALEALQDQYARAGKLDEALAIRDFIRAGGPADLAAWYRR
jgi:beta-lactamase regulating signal transducer with metallopeptidase domain